MVFFRLPSFTNKCTAKAWEKYVKESKLRSVEWKAKERDFVYQKSLFFQIKKCISDAVKWPIFNFLSDYI